MKRSSAVTSNSAGNTAGTGNQRAEPKPLPDFLASLVARALPHCPPGTQFNPAVAMHYPDGSGINWHTDGKRFGPCVMAVSLGTTATMQFRPNGSMDTTSEAVLAPRSFYLLSGAVTMGLRAPDSHRHR